MLQSPQDAYRREFLGFGMFSVGPSCALFRTDAFRRLGGFINTGASSDGVFWLRVCTTETVVLAPGNLFWYRVHAGQELQSLRAQRDYSKLSRLKWNALLSGECPLKGAELEQAKQNCCASIFKSMVSNVKAGRMSLAALEVCSLFIVDWLRYLRKPRRSLNAGSILEHDGEFVVPKERTIELQA